MCPPPDGGRGLADRVALVTGAGIRVGQTIAVTLGAQAMRVVVHYNGSREGADETVRMIEAAGGHAIAVQADLSQPDGPDALIERTLAEYGALDALVNSAAIMLRTPVGEVSVAEWDTMFAVNTRAPFFLSQRAAPALARTRGSIVNIADLAAFETWPAYVPHGITKAAVVQMTRALAHAMAPDVRVNAIAPGAVLLPDDWDEASRQHLIDTTPLERIGTPADVGDAVLYLARAEYVTGDVLVVDGGRHVRT